MSARSEAVQRRALSITALVVGVAAGSLLFLPAVVLLAIADLIRGARRLPLVRLTAFGLCWLWLETIGVAVATAMWLTGRTGDADAHYRLQRWWADRMLSALRVTCGVTIHVDGASELHPAPVVVLVRHASLADSLLAVWVVTKQAQLNPRVVLKKELLADPCLDVVGSRLPNCFLDRQAEDARAGLADIKQLGAGMQIASAAIIFPEGTRTSAAKRRRSLEQIAQRDPARAGRLSGLRHLSPPRPAGTRALIDGANEAGAGVVVAWHVGFDGLDTFSGILAGLARPRTPIEMRLRRVPGPGTLTDPGFTQWLDELWLQADEGVDRRFPCTATLYAVTGSGTLAPRVRLEVHADGR